MNPIAIFFLLVQNREAILKIWKLIEPLLAQILPQVQSGGGTDFTIQWLQESLNKLQGGGLVVDGDYGKATKEAVKKFQAAHGLTVDGWCGVLTQAAVIQALQSA